MAQEQELEITIRPVTRERWKDFETLFGANGACGGCWCMWWKQTSSEYNRRKGPENKQAMQEYIQQGQVPGVLAYCENQPIGWCAVEPRSHYSRLSRSRVLKKVDDLPVWSVTCFYIDRKWRRKGVMIQLLSGAIEYVEAQGGTIVEGYPVKPRKETIPDIYAYPGLLSTFVKVGFREVARRSEARSIMRYTING